MNDFLIFVAPFLVVAISLFAAFYVAPKDKNSSKQ
ncbi:cytochrome bd oxidase small subunit CydS [Solibacillus sp. FSL R7-0682]